MSAKKFLLNEYGIESIEDGFANDPDNATEIQMHMVIKWIEAYAKSLLLTDRDILRKFPEPESATNSDNFYFERYGARWANEQIKSKIDE